MPDYSYLLDDCPDVLTPSEVAALFNIRPRSLHRGRWDNVLRPFRTTGGARRYPEEHIAALLNHSRPPASP
ncbi:helix-turn-helix domain-containing protein [Nocardiopsis sp. RV163]|uniref:helix-turn-helix domain-containing protein n=1 Tax=Nocardiopsis sp. RV163 TaxID=1661388 RepID=UPI00064B94F1|nr:helix-turn-helix domain-containing protein [Nocardiopsis sp. RV163]